MGQFEFAWKGCGFSRAITIAKSIAALAAADEILKLTHYRVGRARPYNPVP